MSQIKGLARVERHLAARFSSLTLDAPAEQREAVRQRWLCAACALFDAEQTLRARGQDPHRRRVKQADPGEADDLRAEIASLNAKIKRREAHLRYRRGRPAPDSTLAQWAHLMSKAHGRLVSARSRTGWNGIPVTEAGQMIRKARALRLSDPSFAGRLP